MNSSGRRKIFERLREADPHPTTELHYNSPFELLIAVILSAQSTDKGVNKATDKLFRVANTPAAMGKLGENGLRGYIKTIGLYNTKAGNIIKTCAILEQKYGGEFPDDRKSLESLPGVGRKTANVLLNTAFGHPVMAVDTHIFRVCNRTGIAPGKTVLEVEKKLERMVPAEFKLNAHHWLILLGRYTCLARKPKCTECLIAELCDFSDKTA